MAMSLNQDGGRITEDLYSKPVQITVKSTDLVERNCVLFLSAQLQSPAAHSQSTSSSSKDATEFVLRLTDETDPLFLYHLRLSAEDYENLRVDQNLAGDFAAFPGKFVRHMNWCSEASKSYKIQLEVQNRFGALKLIERNSSNFKEVVPHLILKLSQGSDAEIKRYLADKVKHLTSLNASLKNAGDDLSKRFQEVNEILQSTSMENEKIKNELKEQNLHLMEQRKLIREKDKNIEIHCEMEQKSERERQKLEYECNKRVTHLESKNADLESRRQNLEDIKCKHESTINGMRTQISYIERELQTAQNEIKTLRKLEEYKLELEERNGNLIQKLRNLERDTENRETALSDLQTLLATTKQELTGLKSKHDNVSAILGRLRQERNDALQECKNKEKDIKFCQIENQKYRLNAKDRSRIAKAQEEVIQNKEKEVEELKKRLDNQEKEILQLSDSLKESESSRKDHEDKLRMKDNMIEHLHQKLNSAEMGAISRVGSHQTSNPLTSSTPIGMVGNYHPHQPPNFSDKTDRLKLSSVDEDEDDDGGHGLPSKYNNKENRISKFAKPVVPRSTSRGSTGLSNINKEKNGQPKNIYNDKISIPKSVLSANNAPLKFPISYGSAYFQ